MPDRKAAAAAEETPKTEEAVEEGLPTAHEEPAAEADLGPHTALAEFLRDGVPVKAGDVLFFAEHEFEHIKELLAGGALHLGTGPDAQAAAEAAERSRESARSTPPV